MRKIVKVLVLMIIFVSVPSVKASENEIVMRRYVGDIFYQKKQIDFLDEDGESLYAYTYNDRVYVPLRAVMKAIGNGVEWSPSNGSINISDVTLSQIKEKDFGEYYFDNDFRGVSIIQLIANPEKYENKFITVSGVISVEFECDRLYLTREDMVFYNNANSVYLNFRTNNILGVTMEELETISTRFATVQGTFKKVSDDSDGWIMTDITYVNAKALTDELSFDLRGTFRGAF